MTKKAWNGGSIEAAMEYAKNMRDQLIAQGAELCDECNGEGGTIHGVCIHCHGAGCTLSPNGLSLEDELVIASCSGELEHD